MDVGPVARPLPSVWSKSIDTALTLARRVRAGRSCVNTKMQTTWVA